MEEEVVEVVEAKEIQTPHLHHVHTDRATLRTSSVHTNHVANLDISRLSVG